MDEVVVFHLTGGVKASRMILGLLVCLTVVGLPLGLWLLAWSRARVELGPDGVRCRPGGFVRYVQVQSFGKGEREAALAPGEVGLEHGDVPRGRLVEEHVAAVQARGRRGRGRLRRGLSRNKANEQISAIMQGK